MICREVGGVASGYSFFFPLIIPNPIIDHVFIFFHSLSISACLNLPHLLVDRFTIAIDDMQQHIDIFLALLVTLGLRWIMT